MKRLTILSVLITILCISVFAQNMVSNPGFENWTDGEPDDWTYDADMTTDQEESIVHSGSYSVKLTWTSDDTQDLEQIIAVSPNTDYTLSGWIYDNDSAGRVRIYARWEDISGSWISNSYPINPNYTSDGTEWEEFNDTYTSPDSAAQALIRISLYDVSPDWSDSATVYADDINFQGGTGSPSINKAYSISATELDVLYSVDISSVDPADYTLTGSETIIFSEATIDGENPKLVHLLGASADMIGDLTLDTITDAANDDTYYEFYAGITPIALTNTNNPAGYIENGKIATFFANVSANDNYNNVWISDNSGAYNGILIYDYDFDELVVEGDEILITATRDEYNGLTELKNPELLSLEQGYAYPAAIIDGSDIANTISVNTDPAEQWEGQLVKINDVLVAPIVKDDLYFGSDDNWATSFVIGDEVDYEYSDFGSILDEAIASGEPIDIKGVVDWSSGNSYYRINPRSQNDLPAGDYPNLNSSSFVLHQNFPNPFSNSTTISFSINHQNTKDTKIEIYNIKGQKVETLNIEDSELNIGSVVWDGKNENGKEVPSGIYFYKLDAGDKYITKKLIILR